MSTFCSPLPRDQIAAPLEQSSQDRHETARVGKVHLATHNMLISLTKTALGSS